MSESQICANSCPKSKGGEPCAHCVLVTAVEAPTQRDAEREDEAFEIMQRFNACRSTQIVEQLDQSIEDGKELIAPMLDRSDSRADIVVFCWIALILVVAVMWAFGQSKPVALMCGAA